MNGPEDPVRVVVVDDEPMVCAHLRTILDSSGDITVVGEAHDGAAGVEAVIRHRPGVVLMDLRMPEVDGITAIGRIKELAAPPYIVVLTTFDADHYVLRALDAGASGFLLKSTPPRELIGLVRVAAGGHTVMSRTATDSLLAAGGRRREARGRRTALLAELTDREREVLACVARGMSNAEIAAALFVGEATVKGHVSRVLAKTQCANRTQAGLLAYEAGLTG
ncbi:DNA-binding response regulator [Spongiactinospora rosea]|uniref:DNA-binding response regulator n=1 Tax=Spongiactinospora rosea TaxID=2248750 RepID=A0A366M6V8_9ACTN|nr:response regulator transcription factor [Spongiactinospora rosea]RBQ21905.1 DNA-binding response regulator [Spongiactinospora rosea]